MRRALGSRSRGSRSHRTPAALWLGVLVLAVLAGSPAASRAQTPPGPPAGPAAVPDTAASEPRVGRVSVVGNASVDSARVLRTFEVPSGSRFSEDMVRRGIRKLFALGLFGDIYVNPVQHGSEVDLVIHVQERPRIGKIEFSGNKKKDSKDLEKHLVLHAGEAYQPTAVETQIDSLLRFYHGEGYARAEITAHADTLASGNQVTLRFEVKEGEKVKIERVEFQGNAAFPARRLRKVMKSHARGALGGGDVKDENFAEDVTKIEAVYHNNGYRDARVDSHELKPGSRPDRLVYVLKIDEGGRYEFGRVSWSGNTAVATPALEKGWKQKRSRRVYDASRIERAQSNAYSEYAEKGYLYINVEPRETLRDSIVDVAFEITEGQPSKVRLVNILGNKGTRENVIRREITIHEGDRFKRSALVRTQGDIFRLGLFEDVQVDFAPVESTDVDINLKVKEKQVGTASAGAGYTSESGVTGFLELGHNNVLGNGQSVNLHLERGGRREDYYLSFTEPWFRGTPTLLGFTVFNTLREVENGSGAAGYNDRRVGGSAQIGRPLPWPDYSRGSVGYRLENVKITPLGATLTAEDSTVLAGVKVGRPVLTSSLDLNFNRNSANNPFYPTKGTRLTIESDLAGGAFGGEVNFNKHRLEGRLYLPSLVKGLTTMLKARWGILSPYTDQRRGVPPYERFRLGGGTTIDPLRGYDDYEVVPDKFRLAIPHYVRVIDTIDSTGGHRDTTYKNLLSYFSAVRYPGGKFMSVYSVEQQFPIVHPLHGVVFFDAGNTWDLGREVKPFQLKLSLGLGFRMEIPLLGNIGFDYGYGFNHEEFNSTTGTFRRRGRFRGHFLIGNLNF